MVKCIDECRTYKYFNLIFELPLNWLYVLLLLYVIRGIMDLIFNSFTPVRSKLELVAKYLIKLNSISCNYIGLVECKAYKPRYIFRKHLDFKSH